MISNKEPVQCSVCKQFFCSKVDLKDHTCKGPPPPRVYFPPKNCPPNEPVQGPSISATRVFRSRRSKQLPIRYDDDRADDDDLLDEDLPPPAISLMEPVNYLLSQGETDEEMGIMDADVDGLPPPTLDDMSMQVEVQLEEGDNEIDVNCFDNAPVPEGSLNCGTSTNSFNDTSQEDTLTQFDTRISPRKHMYSRIRYRQKAKGKMTRRCPFCPKQFQYESKLKEHLVVHTREGRLQKLKQQLFPKLAVTLKSSHQNKKSKKAPPAYQCNLCTKKFNKSSALRSHQLLVHNPKPIACNHCPKAFSSTTAFKKHFLGMHTANNEKPFQCAYCEKAYGTATHYRRHLRNAHPDKPKPESIEWDLSSFKIDPRDFTRLDLPANGGGVDNISDSEESAQLSEENDSESDWEKSQKTSPKKNPKKNGKGVFKCTVCDTTYSYKKSLDRHMKKQHAENQDEQLQKESIQKNVRANNEEKSSSNSKPKAAMAVVVNGNSTKGTVNKKVSKKALKGKGTFTCNICGSKCSYEYNMRRHIKRTHRQASADDFTSYPFACSLCEKVYTAASNLRRHVRRDHGGSKPSGAPIQATKKVESKLLKICKKLKLKSNISPTRPTLLKKAKDKYAKKKQVPLKRPRSIHKCQFCRRLFPTKTALTAHVTRAHPGKIPEGKPYLCQGCKKGFTTSTELNRHKCPTNVPGSPPQVQEEERQAPWWDKDTMGIKSVPTVDSMLNEADKQFLQMICNL